ncbi:MAG TPA: CHY zinc finger protein [Cyclobacteriaceae bacterium]|nr:CHY zinc finger protein [Cyclobacteriaceae bacterium]
MISKVFGHPVDNQTRCVHYHSPTDVIAIKFKCCDQYFPCYSCHEETADHKAVRWEKSEFDKVAILCGVCQSELTINQYLNCDNSCPHCGARFNPGCANHYPLYFDMEK